MIFESKIFLIIYFFNLPTAGVPTGLRDVRNGGEDAGG